MREDDPELFELAFPAADVIAVRKPDVVSVELKVTLGDGRTLSWSCQDPLEVEVQTERRDYVAAGTFHDLWSAGGLQQVFAGVAIRIRGGLPYRIVLEAYKGNAKG